MSHISHVVNTDRLWLDNICFTITENACMQHCYTSIHWSQKILKPINLPTSGNYMLWEWLTKLILWKEQNSKHPNIKSSILILTLNTTTSTQSSTFTSRQHNNHETHPLLPKWSQCYQLLFPQNPEILEDSYTVESFHPNASMYWGYTYENMLHKDILMEVPTSWILFPNSEKGRICQENIN